jgi:hypothetical protein
VTRRVLLIAPALALFGCGYPGEPLPPLLNIPQRVTDLAAVERGSKIIVQFTVPKLTTESVVIKGPLHFDLRAGEPGPAPFDTNVWVASAISVGEVTPVEGRVRYEVAAMPWIGKEVVFAVKVSGPGGKDAGWSNPVVVSVVPSLNKPDELKAQPVREGVRLTWRGSGPSYRVYRRAQDEKEFSVAATSNKNEWSDVNTEYGKTYRYLVQAVAGQAESEPSDEVDITPRDIFPPPIPSGLTAVPTTNSIELAWEPVTDADLAGYRIYRVPASGGDFERIGETTQAPSFSDRKIEPGKQYRYAVTAFDGNGNESERSQPIEVPAP